MSATGRGKKREAFDFYPTPQKPVISLMNRRILPVGGNWLEPCVGAGNIVHSVNTWHQNRGMISPSWTGVDLREFEEVEAAAFGCDELIAGTDFLSWTPPGIYDAIVTNPPYSVARQFAEHALNFAPVVAMLLRVGFLGSIERFQFNRQFPANVYVLSNRPSFTGDGGSDSSEYAWFVWDRHRDGGRWEVLPPI